MDVGIDTAGEAKHRLSTLREELEVKQDENELLQSKFLELSAEYESHLSRNQQVGVCITCTLCVKTVVFYMNIILQCFWESVVCKQDHRNKLFL